MANFNSNQDIDYKFENIKFETADIKMKAIFWDIIRKEQKALGEIEKKIDTINDENLKQRLTKLSGKILDTLVKMYNSGDEISLLFQQLDQTLQELGEIEDENIARIIANINYEPQEQHTKKQQIQQVKENNTEPVVEKEPVDHQQDKEPEIDKTPVEETTEVENPEIQSVESQEEQAVEQIQEEPSKDVPIEKEVVEEEETNKNIQSQANDTEETTKNPKELQIEQVNEEIQQESEIPEDKELSVMVIPNIEEKQQEDTIVTIPSNDAQDLPEMVFDSTEEQQPEVNSEIETSTLPEIVGIEDSTQQDSEEQQVVETPTEESTLAEIEPEQHAEIEQPNEPQQEEPLVSITDIQDEVQQEKEEQNTQEEKTPDFIKITDVPARAILTTTKQVTKLRNSRETQEALFTSNSIKNNSNLMSNFEQPIEHSQPSTEELLAQVEKLYSEGKTEEAEKLMERITENSEQIQPVNIENYTNNGLNQIQPTYNMLNVPSTSDQKQFTLAA